MLRKLFKSLFGPGPDYKQLMADGAMVVDVRTAQEFAGGHVKGSVNIPLDILPKQAETLATKKRTIITVCRSGNRSAMAKNILRQKGIEAFNGGSWNSLQQKIQ